MKTFANDPAGVGEGMAERILTLPDGRRIRALLAGDRPGPLVVFLPGGGTPASMYLPVQRALAQRARTISYDRGSIGGSDRDAAPRTLARSTEELIQVLDAVDPGGNQVILVGLSWGGAIARAAACQVPGRIKALVLVDSSVSAVHEMVPRKNLMNMLGGLVIRLQASPPMLPITRKMLAKTVAQAKLAAADKAVFIRDMASGLSGMLTERDGIFASTRMLREVEDQGIPPQISVTVIKAGKVEPGGEAIDRRLADVLSKLAADHPLGRYVVAEDSFHVVTFFQPDLVIAEISRLLEG